MRIAAIDLGSNSFHLLVVEAYRDGTFVPMLRDKQILRLGDVVAREGLLPAEACDRAAATMRRFKALIDRASVIHTMACATSAIRQAANGRELTSRISAETGLDVAMLTGDEEARLVFDAVRASVVLQPSSLCLDLGGGSLEVIVGGPAGLRHAQSVELGASRLSTELVAHDPPSGDDVRRLRKRLIDVLAPVAERMAEFHPTMAVGTSGTLCDLVRLATARATGVAPTSVNQLRIGREDLLRVHDEIMGATAAERLKMPGLDPRRAELMPAGAMVLITAMELFGFGEMTVSEWALREGIVLDVIRRSMGTTAEESSDHMRRSSVLSLARRCNWQEAHSRQVARLATDLFDQTGEIHDMGPGERELLEHASLLHDIGHHISSESHHKHTGYLIQNGRLRGFAPEEVDTLAALARYHRRGDPKTSHQPFGALGVERQRSITRLAGILRIADGLDFGHTGGVGAPRVEIDDETVTVWVGGQTSLELEVWGGHRKRHLFERAFGRRVALRKEPGGSEETTAGKEVVIGADNGQQNVTAVTQPSI